MISSSGLNMGINLILVTVAKIYETHSEYKMNKRKKEFNKKLDDMLMVQITDD